ncbi:DUF2971 domain-containing protein [Aeromonas hydrophila]|uniref:DUF2971 domain-containing protein n=1 Tax=Aeromonas hydrophila TaxID=644 RepID=UPI000D0D3627|nr:DUF2971 domain-containing protein [Aeromonas hydrophila]AVP84662.1 hypothetical protein C7K70_11680 [Aeromonas hydrophila]
MNILFKYYKSLDLSYFKHPTMKISNTTKLNDPFERQIDSGLMDLVLNTFPEAVPESESAWKKFAPARNELSFLSRICQIGIISLSETPRNILMWSHYADQYKGICIGYRSDFLDKYEGMTHDVLPTIYHPQKINYDNSRYDPLTDIFTANDKDELRKQIIQMSLLRKGDDWLYEKEHRSIIPMEFYNRVICIGEKNAYEYESEFDFLTAINERHLKIKKTPSKSIIDHEGLIFALEIDKKSIVSVYFGIEADDFFQYVELYEEIIKDPELSHVKFYIATPSNTKFELRFSAMEEFINAINNGT